MARRDWRQAHQHCEMLLHAQPDCAEGWYLFSQVKLELGALQQAVSSVRRAVALETDNSRFRLHLAVALAHVADQQAALETLSTVRLAAPSAAEHALVGTVLSLCNHHEYAMQSFLQASEMTPEEPRHWLNLALAQRALGHVWRAEECCSRAISLGDLPQAHYLRAELGTHTLGNNHVADLQKRLQDPSLPVTDRVYLQFALGKEQEDVGSFAEAFQAFQLANSLHRSTLRYRLDADLSVIEALVSEHTKVALPNWPTGPDDSRPVFIVGLPRSGTTLVERILQTHSGVVSRGERSDLAIEISAQGRGLLDSGKVTAAALVEASGRMDTAALGARYLQRVMPGTGRPLRVIDKMPINYLYCGLIRSALPEARIVAVRRAPMDSCFAAWKSLLLGPYGFTYDLADMARYYAEFHRLMAHWREILPESHYQEVFYEDLVVQPEATSKALCGFLGLDWEPAMLDFHRSTAPSVTASASQVRQPIYRSSIGRWRHYAEQLAPLQQALAEAGLDVKGD